MARKTARKSATRTTARKKTRRAGAVRTSATGSAKKAPKKSARKPAKKTSAKRSTRSLAPRPINSGRGPSPAEIGAAVVEAFNDHRPDIDLWNRFWAEDVESIEGVGVSLAWRGRDAMQAKGESWMAENIVHSASAEGPYIGATGFAVRFRMDVENKTSGDRSLMEEVGVYTVKNGKVVREEFMYGTTTPILSGGEAEEFVATARFEEEIIPI